MSKKTAIYWIGFTIIPTALPAGIAVQVRAQSAENANLATPTAL